MKTRSGIALIFCLIAIGPATAADSGPGADPTLQALLVELVQSKDDARPAIYARLARLTDPVVLPALNAYESGRLRLHEGRPVIYQARIELADGTRVYPIVDALSLKPLVGPKGEPLYAERLGITRKAPPADRKALRGLIARLALFDRDPEKRKDAITAAGDRAEQAARDVLAQGLQDGRWGNLTYEAQVALARIDLQNGDRYAQLKAAAALEELVPVGSTDQIDSAREKAVAANDTQLAAAIAAARQAIERRERFVSIIQETFAGLSLGSILILMGLGLSIIFGLMRVINMAHGEFMMLGAFAALVVSRLFRTYLPESLFDFYWFVAIPAAFLAAALVGWLCEVTVIRRLYGRPLDSLLATWGISLILIQGVRVAFGDTVAITPPSWLGGGWEALRGLVLPWNRLFIIGYCAACVGLVYLTVYRTRFGLLLRATQQNRAMAAALGVDTRKIDALAFAFGTGLAGLAGCAIVLFDKLNPQMGQGYIVDSFMVVIVGGVGKLSGVVMAGTGLGFLTKYLEPLLQAVYGKVAVLLLVILFIQRWPSGLFADKGRLADD